MTIPDPDHAQGRPQRFGPHTRAIANFLIEAGAPADSLAVLIEVNNRWPGLPLKDFLGAVVLVETMLMKVEGHA
jgi:hypothetical protein